MSILILSILLIALALVTLGAALKMLIKVGWFLKWLRGTGGILMMLLVVICSALGYELLTFNKANEGEVIATLTFSKIGKQDFNVELVDVNDKFKNYNILGDQWQLDVKLVSLQGLGEIGLPSYKMDRISGRYLTLEQEKHDQRTVYELSSNKSPGIWESIQEYEWLPFVRANYGSAAFMPMEDGAIYQVKLFQNGLKAIAVNSQAKEASESW